MNNEGKYKAYLHENLDLLNRSAMTLQESLERCREIGLKENYSSLESDAFDALTSKFSRTSDILTQRILKLLPLLYREDLPAFLDRVYFAEKIEALESAERMKRIRELRNEITHEYVISNLNEIYRSTMEMCIPLLDEVKKIDLFLSNKFL